jgi:nicotinamidase/pyrazinamidase
VRTIFFDIDTQLDFLYPAGALAVPGAQEIVGPLSVLTRFAAANGIQIVSTTDAHAENDPEFRIWKPHCVVGTVGQQKASGTLLDQPLVLSSAQGALEQIRGRVAGARQIIVEKQQLDCFTNPNVPGLLDTLQADRYIVYGLVTELCVRCAAMGLLSLGAHVELVSDAVQSLSPSAEQHFFRDMRARGGILTTIAAVTV